MAYTNPVTHSPLIIWDLYQLGSLVVDQFEVIVQSDLFNTERNPWEAQLPGNVHPTHFHVHSNNLHGTDTSVYKPHRKWYHIIWSWANQIFPLADQKVYSSKHSHLGLHDWEVFKYTILWSVIVQTSSRLHVGSHQRFWRVCLHPRFPDGSCRSCSLAQRHLGQRLH